MPFDPFGLEKVHENVERAIRDNEPGHAQSDVSGVLVSYIRNDFPGGFYHAPMSSQMKAAEMLDEMMVDVARGEGMASPATFHRSQLEWAITNRRRYPERWVKKHKEATLLEALSENRPELFV